ncbi:IPT/TIG domain-containing protein [Shewanella sp. SW36]|uniref:IPT/TIG domain-containing protein n=1 Tax=unclassified Shewanella TaxID=196818 RepID=UPI0021DAAFAF|nr:MULTISPECIES: IPT/TIG domain-containing protein [unclassified Shewanella]MCU7975276.1 IPT/TIG domain-containing protein [Shewanella sp. SW36]MCU7990666.1 IPT/TIG domain-containing protein [Shewanella sp. SW1]MCU8017615.1 IPT/TIG domain-containing protein [Shewanella sp. SM72]MCU8051871.1 IPT/TIG domain-containing protein [Shewanella sp. SM43]
MMDSTRKNGWLKKKQTDIDVNHLITLFAKSRFITRTFILRLPHSARALSLIALLAMPLFVQATTVTPTEHQGTWENKDEDGDGVPDELDDYPFDAGKTSFEIFEESEENNLISSADVTSQIPLRIHGVLPNSGDTDVFKIEIPNSVIESGSRLSFIIKGKGRNFFPTANLFDANGNALGTTRPSDFTATGYLKYHFIYQPSVSGSFYLSVSSTSQDTPSDYVAEVFIDSDSDGVSDQLEASLGADKNKKDTDGDGISDAIEIFVPDINDMLLVDIDQDGIPNFMDDDSDADGLKDTSETGTDLDGDMLGNYADLDADGNGIFDYAEAIDPLRPIDTDLDGVADYLDLDDDSDNILDIYDAQRTVAIIPPAFNNQNRLSITAAKTKVSESYSLYKQGLRGYSLDVTGNFTPNQRYILIIELDYEIYNININTTNAGEISATIPQSTKIKFGNKEATISIYDPIDNISNGYSLTVLDPQVPIISSLGGDTYASGDRISIKGWNFTPATKAWIGGRQLQLEELVSSNEVIFALPNILEQQTIQLENGWGKGNEFSLSIANKFSAILDVPSTIYSSIPEIFYIDASGNFYEFSKVSINKVLAPALSNPELILYINRNGKYIKFLRSIFQVNSQSDNQIVSIDSTIHAWSKAYGFSGNISELKNRPKYSETYDFLLKKLENNIYYFGFESASELDEYTNKIIHLTGFQNNKDKKIN